jgi:hypothetical protein
MAIEIVDLPIKNGDFPWFSIAMLVYQRVVYLRVAEAIYLSSSTDHPLWQMEVLRRLSGNPNARRPGGCSST